MEFLRTSLTSLVHWLRVRAWTAQLPASLPPTSLNRRDGLPAVYVQDVDEAGLICHLSTSSLMSIIQRHTRRQTADCGPGCCFGFCWRCAARCCARCARGRPRAVLGRANIALSALSLTRRSRPALIRTFCSCLRDSSVRSVWSRSVSAALREPKPCSPAAPALPALAQPAVVSVLRARLYAHSEHAGPIVQRSKVSQPSQPDILNSESEI